MERKRIFRRSGVAICSMFFYSSFLAACNKSDATGTTSVTPPKAGFTLDLTAPQNAALLNVGGYVNHGNINVVHTSGGFVAFSALCTHDACVVGYNSTVYQFQCPCDGGIFDISGNVVSGPATVALPSYTVTQSGNNLTVN